MSTTIQDGQGGNLRVGVISDGKNNRLLVNAESLAFEGNRAAVGATGIVHATCYFDAASSGGLLSFTNDSPDKNLLLTRLYIDAHLMANPVEIVQVKQPATVSGGVDRSSTANVQKNFGSLITTPLTVTVAGSGSPLTYTGGTEYHNFSMESLKSQQRDMFSTNIITPGTTVLWGYSTDRVGGHNMVATESIAFSVNYIPVDV